jgi:hypothetical protein
MMLSWGWLGCDPQKLYFWFWIRSDHLMIFSTTALATLTGVQAWSRNVGFQAKSGLGRSAELRHLGAKKHVELPKTSMVLHQENFRETVSWDVYAALHTTQLRNVPATDKQPGVLADTLLLRCSNI